jgi:TolB-like protein
MERYRINLVGPFGLFAPDGHRIDVSSQKAIALIAIVVVSSGGVRARRKLEAMLWGTRSAKQAQDSLRREISNLRKLLAEHGASELLISETKRVALAIDRIDVDIFALGLGAPDPHMHIAGDFLEGIDLPDCEEFEDWLRDERDRVQHMIDLALPEPAGPLPSAREIFGAEVPTVRETLEARGYPLPPPKPSVAVLPFTALGPDAQAWLGTGLADEISVCLSGFPQLFIVSSGASRALAEQGYSRTEIASRLGVRYLLEGTILSDGGRLRVLASLIDGRNEEQFWSDTFVGKADASFAFQAEIAGRIAPQIWTKVDHAERQRSLRLIGPVSGDYERYWRANALFRSWEKEATAEALNLTLQLVETDPTCPWSTSLAAYCCSIAYMLNYFPDRETMLRRAIQNYQAAMRYGADNVEALGYCAGTLINIGGDMEMADRIVGTALRLLPAHQPTLFWGGWVDVLRGDAERATERFELALRINPATGVLGQTLSGIGFATLQRGKVEDAYQLFVEADRAASGFPPTLLGLCVTAHLVGRHDQAKALAAMLVSRGGLALTQQMRLPEHRQLLEAVLRAAGDVKLGGREAIPEFS